VCKVKESCTARSDMIAMPAKKLKDFLDAKADQYNHLSFIKDDPVCVPRQFSMQQDIEIAGLFAAIFAWGNRTTIINKARQLVERMDYAPYQFIMQHKDSDLKKLLSFKHRTFNADDLLYFVYFLHHHYKENPTLETAFSRFLRPKDKDITNALIGFRDYFFSLEHLRHVEKHISTPAKNATCKRLNMFLRWMVRRDDKGVDFGIWKNIAPAQLICPIDVHVARVARRFNLLKRPSTDWQAALELTAQLRLMDRQDPVKYDFALFGLGVVEKF
jgi:uncharacterized protein (TIGR02757 family)